VFLIVENISDDEQFFIFKERVYFNILRKKTLYQNFLI